MTEEPQTEMTDVKESSEKLYPELEPPKPALDLSPEEIELGKSQINELHPLKTLTMHDMFHTSTLFMPPEIAVKVKPPKGEEKHSIKRQRKLKNFTKNPIQFLSKKNLPKLKEKSGMTQFMRGAMGAEDSPSKFEKLATKPEEVEENKYLMLGFGINYYFLQLRVLIGLFVIWALLMLGPMVYYIDWYSPNYSHRVWLRTTLGNVGYAETECSRAKLDYKLLVPFCTDGRIIGELYNIGAVWEQETNIHRCTTQADSKCEKFLNNDFLTTKFNTDCVNKESCEIDITKAFKDSNHECAMTMNNEIFAQFSCVETEQQIEEKSKDLAVFACADIFGTLLFFLAIWYMRMKLPIKQDKWDTKTVSTGDYTLKYTIPHNTFENFCGRLREKYAGDPNAPEPGDISYLFEYKLYLIDGIEEALAKAPAIQKRKQNVRVANINFSFDNASLLNLLMERGEAIARDDREKVGTLDETIDVDLKENYETYSVPRFAFVTFEDEEAYLRGFYLPEYPMKSDKLTLPENNKALFFKETPEPTNIKWENQMVKTSELIARRVAIFIVLAILVCCSVMLIYTLQHKVRELKALFPNVPCDTAHINFLQKTEGRFQDAAYDDWWYKNDDKSYKYTGELKCFCKNQKKHLGKQTTADKSYKHSARKAKGGKLAEDKICYEQLTAAWKPLVFGISISILINVFNFLFKKYMLKILSYSRFKKVSALDSSTMIWIFLTQFINTALILLGLNANLTEIYSPLGVIFNGVYGDFEKTWYNNVGCLFLNTMVINTFFPVTEQLIRFLMTNFKKWKDQGWKRQYSTKSLTVANYVNVYGGPEFSLPNRFAALLKMIFVVLLYGTGLPMMYILASITLIFLFFLDKICMAKQYQRPPYYDELLSQISLKILPYAGIIHLLVGGWMMTNPHLMYNPKTDGKLNEVTHTLDSIYDMNIGTPYYVLGVIFLLYYLNRHFSYTLISYCIKWFGKAPKREGAVEHLRPYFWALMEDDVEWWIEEEREMREKFNTKILDDDAYLKLMAVHRNIKAGKFPENRRVIENVHCYDILANPEYTTLFQYFPVKDRVAEDEDSEKVRIALYLAYFSRNKVEKFKMVDKTSKFKDSAIGTNLLNKFKIKKVKDFTADNEEKIRALEIEGMKIVQECEELAEKEQKEKKQKIGGILNIGGFGRKQKQKAVGMLGGKFQMKKDE